MYARSQFILAIDQSLAPFEDLRRKINADLKWEASSRADRVEMMRYIAALERIGLLLEERQLAISTVNRFYGARFAILVTSAHGANVNSVIRDKPADWRGFVWLYRQLKQPRHLVDPPWSPRALRMRRGKLRGLD